MNDPVLEYLATELAWIQGQICSSNGRFSNFVFERMKSSYLDELRVADSLRTTRPSDTSDQGEQ